jgi:hypothetical protein
LVNLRPTHLGDFGLRSIHLDGNRLTGCIPKSLERKLRDLNLELCED